MIEKLKELLKDCDNYTHLDCDGMTNVIHARLKDENIEHKCFTGTVEFGKVFPIHYWIEIDDIIIDFKASKWLNGATHGVFTKEENKNIYDGDEYEPMDLPSEIIDALMVPPKVMKPMFKKPNEKRKKKLSKKEKTKRKKIRRN